MSRRREVAVHPDVDFEEGDHQVEINSQCEIYANLKG